MNGLVFAVTRKTNANYQTNHNKTFSKRTKKMNKFFVSFK